MAQGAEKVKILFTIRFNAAFHCGSGLPRGLVNRSVRRDGNEYLMVPGSTIKGVLRERCEQIADLMGLRSRPPHAGQWEVRSAEDYARCDLVERLFGSPLRPGTLAVDDARMHAKDRKHLEDTRTAAVEQVMERTQVSLSRRTGAARPGLLFTSEFGMDGLRFQGEISGYLEDARINDDPAEPSYGLVLLTAALLSVDRLGGNRSTGGGLCWIDEVEVSAGGKAWAVNDLLDRLNGLVDGDVAWEVYQ